MSGLGGNVIFSVPKKDKALILCVHIPLVYKHLFYKYFVRWSIGQVTKGKRALLLMDVVVLVFWVKIKLSQNCYRMLTCISTLRQLILACISNDFIAEKKDLDKEFMQKIACVNKTLLKKEMWLNFEEIFIWIKILIP